MSQTSSQEQGDVRPSAGTARFLSFSDAVVAIAATLLVLPLVEAVTTYDPSQGIGPFITGNKGLLFAFVLSFLVIYRFWSAHHAIFGEGVPLTATLRWLNGLWLLSIVFLPVPTRLIGSHTTSRGADALYIATMLGAVLTTAASHWLIGRAAGQPAMEMALSVLAFPLALVVALVLAALVPSVGLYALLLLFPAGYLQNRYLRPWVARAMSAHGEPDRPGQQAEDEQATGPAGV
jgi:uncharacterized membrane protein